MEMQIERILVIGDGPDESQFTKAASTGQSDVDFIGAGMVHDGKLGIVLR